MKWEQINKSLQGHFAANWLVTPVDYLNTKFIQPENSPWVRMQVVPNEARFASVGSIGGGVCVRSIGLVSVTVFVPEGSTETLANQYADDIAAIFFGQEIDGILLRDSGRSAPRIDDGWYQTTITIPFELDTFH